MIADEAIFPSKWKKIAEKNKFFPNFLLSQLMQRLIILYAMSAFMEYKISALLPKFLSVLGINTDGFTLSFLFLLQFVQKFGVI